MITNLHNLTSQDRKFQHKGGLTVNVPTIEEKMESATLLGKSAGNYWPSGLEMGDEIGHIVQGFLGWETTVVRAPGCQKSTSGNRPLPGGTAPFSSNERIFRSAIFVLTTVMDPGEVAVERKTEATSGKALNDLPLPRKWWIGQD